MEFEELPALWQKARPATPSDTPPEAVLAEMIGRSRRLERDVRRRDRLETVGALLLAPVFGICSVLGSHPVARLGAAILTLSCVAIPLRLGGARRAFSPGRRDRSVRAFLREEQERVMAQARLLRSVLWWYLLPLGVGVVLFFAGGTRSVAATLVYTLVVGVFFWRLYRLNQQAVASELEPRLAELEAMLGALADDVAAPRASLESR